MSNEIEQLKILIENLDVEISTAEEVQHQLGMPVNISQAFMDRYTDLNKRIEILRESNSGFDKENELKEKVKQAKESLEKVRETQLEIIQKSLNEEMVRINDIIYNGERYAPSISFDNARSGNPKYVFGTLADGGTGTNYKGLILFDLSILNITELPVVCHDSLIFKNIADLPIDRIMQVYSQSTKQVFIAFDKKDAFSEETKK